MPRAAFETAGRGDARARRQYTTGEEISHSVTHGVGALFGVVALTLLVVWATRAGSGRALAGGIVFGAALVLQYTFSCLYHSFPWPRTKHVFKVLDHAGIYLLIAGSYTPFTLVTLAGARGWTLFAVVWSLAAAGIASEAFWVYRPKWLSAAVYLAMGWLVVTTFGPLVAALPKPGLALLLAGGLSYTFGTVFYVLRKVPYAHMVWHLFVLAGSACHFLSVLLYVTPVR